MKKLFHIIHYKYGDVCSDPYYGKTGRIVSTETVCCSEQAVKIAVNLLNKFNHSYYGHEPEHKWDWDCFDEDYFYYREVGVTTSVVDLVKRFAHKQTYKKWTGKL